VVLIFVFILILGCVLFLIAIFFYRQKRTGSAEHIYEESAPVHFSREEQMEPVRSRADAYIPVLQGHKSVPGVKEFELIHFIGRGALFTLESLKDPEQVMIKEGDMVPEIEGSIVLTSHKLLIYNAKSARKIVYGAIGRYHFRDPFLVIMRKDVKKKKDVVRIFERIPEFKYIFSVLA